MVRANGAFRSVMDPRCLWVRDFFESVLNGGGDNDGLVEVAWPGDVLASCIGCHQPTTQHCPLCQCAVHTSCQTTMLLAGDDADVMLADLVTDAIGAGAAATIAATRQICWLRVYRQSICHWCRCALPHLHAEE